MRLLSYLATSLFLLLCSGCATHAALADVEQTSFIEALMKREHFGQSVHDEERHQIYYEVIAAKTGDLRPLPYANPELTDLAYSQIFIWNEEYENGPELLFDQGDSAGYFLAGDDPWSPDRKHLAIYRLYKGFLSAGVVNLETREAKFFDISPELSLGFSWLTWISDHEFVVIASPLSENPLIFNWVNSVRHTSAFQESGWMSRAVTSDVVGAGEYYEPPQPRASILRKVDIKSKHVSDLVGFHHLSAPSSPNGKIAALQIENEERRRRGCSSLSQWQIVDTNSFREIPITLGDICQELDIVSWSETGKYILIAIRRSSAEAPNGSVFAIVNVLNGETSEEFHGATSDFAWRGDQLISKQRQDQVVSFDGLALVEAAHTPLPSPH